MNYLKNKKLKDENMGTEVGNVDDMRECPACQRTGELELLHSIPFAHPIYKRQTCPVCGGTGQIQKLKKKSGNRRWVCPKIRELNHKIKSVLISDCKQTECTHFLYCTTYLRVPKKDRTKHTVSETFKRSNCFYYFCQSHTCMKKEINTNRLICAMCYDFIEKSKWKITFHLHNGVDNVEAATENIAPARGD